MERDEEMRGMSAEEMARQFGPGMQQAAPLTQEERFRYDLGMHNTPVYVTLEPIPRIPWHRRLLRWLLGSQRAG